jgi:hypothetical protein
MKEWLILRKGDLLAFLLSTVYCIFTYRLRYSKKTSAFVADAQKAGANNLAIAQYNSRLLNVYIMWLFSRFAFILYF